METKNGRKSSNLVKSCELIYHFIKPSSSTLLELSTLHFLWSLIYGGIIKRLDSLTGNLTFRNINLPVTKLMASIFFLLFCLTDTPMAVVTFGRSLNPKSILEGADVYFECHVKSNPPFYNITWRNNVRIFFLFFSILIFLLF